MDPPKKQKNRPSSCFELEKCFLKPHCSKTQIALVTGPGGSRRRSTEAPRQAALRLGSGVWGLGSGSVWALGGNARGGNGRHARARPSRPSPSILNVRDGVLTRPLALLDGFVELRDLGQLQSDLLGDDGILLRLGQDVA